MYHGHGTVPDVILYMMDPLYMQTGAQTTAGLASVTNLLISITMAAMKSLSVELSIYLLTTCVYNVAVVYYCA